MALVLALIRASKPAIAPVEALSIASKRAATVFVASKPEPNLLSV
jgi:hypothetical protein